MQFISSLLSDSVSGMNWLNAASVALLVGFAIATLRFRKLYLDGRDAQRNSNDLIENLSEGVYRSLPDGNQLSANRALVKLNGYDSEKELLAGVTDIALEWYVDPNRRAEFRALLRRDGKVEDFVSEIYRHKTRERIWVTESARIVRDKKSGQPLFYEGSVREITETMRRLRVEEQFRKLTSLLPGGLFQFVRKTNGEHEVLYLSPGFSQITGIPEYDECERPSLFGDYIRAEDRPAFMQSLQESARLIGPWDHEFRISTVEGGEKWVRVMARPEVNDGDITWHGYLADISMHKKHEMEIQELAYYDPLTRLPNRRMFMNQMAHGIAECKRGNRHGALLFIDLDNFKTLNDTQGHDTGDEFLIQVADRLRGCLDPLDMVARIGGDEFVVVVSDANPARSNVTRRAINSANRILGALRAGFDLDGQHHVASASVGIVVFDGQEERADEILKRADIAMYQAKGSGRNRMALFDPATMDREAERYRLLNDLRAAFKSDELDLHYQPMVDENGGIVGAEALIRWNHPTLGMIYPDKFVPQAEQFGLNNELGRFVFNKGLGTLAAWRRNPATAGLRLALNVSVQTFSSEEFVPMLRDLITLYCVDATKLTLELTEHVMAKDQTRIAERMSELKTLGIRLSLDDFGTGYSSLAYLKRLPFDEIKIDGGFVADIENSENDRALVKTILAMARTLGLSAVAEHVENVRQEAFLRAFGCDFFQGYLYSKAVPGDDFLDLFNSQTVLEHRQSA